MRRVSFGARDLTVSRLLFGTLTMGPLQRDLPPERGAELICYAADRGVNCVDTAEIYGTYPHIKAALREKPALMVCTKSYAYDLDGAKRSVELAQEGIGRERIDIFLLHEQESEHTLRGHAEALTYYMQLREAGTIGAVGLSTHRVAAVRAAARWPGIDVVFAMINRRGLGIADGTREEMECALQSAHRAGRGVLAMKALGGGHLIGDRQRAFQYALSMDFLDAIALGMQSEAEIDYNVAVINGNAPDPIAEMVTESARRSLIVQDWCEGCGKCVARCGQKALKVDPEKSVAVVDAGRCVRCGYCAAVCPQFCLKVI